MEENNVEEGGPFWDVSRLTGCRLGDALRMARENGYDIEDITITAPPGLEISEYDDSFRVLRVHTAGNKRLTILVCKPL